MTIIISFIVGFVAGALVFRNNTAKANTFVDAAKAKAEEAVKEAKASFNPRKK